MIPATIFVVFAFAMIFAAISDLLTMTIANRVSLVLIGSFALIAPLTGMDLQTYGMHFAVAFGVLVTTFILFAIGGMGGGDAKLLAATALWCGWGMPLVEYLAYSAILGGWLTVGIIMYRGTLVAEVAGEKFEFLGRIGDKNVGVPYGIALGIGGLVTAPQMPLIEWAVRNAAG